MKKAEITMEDSNAFAFFNCQTSQRQLILGPRMKYESECVRAGRISVEILPKYVQNRSNIIPTASKRYNRKEVLEYLKKHPEDLTKVRINILDFLVDTSGKRKN